MRKQTQSEFINRANIVHGSNYDYSKVEYKNCDTKVEILCIKHNISFFQTPWNHSKGFSRCPKCKTEKQKETFVNNYGVDNPMKVVKIQKQAVVTKKEIYGPDWVNNKKARETCMSKYGVDWSSKDPAIFIKQQAKQTFTKLYTFPSGVSYNVQGYEPLAINLLLTQGYSENDIQLINRPSIKYIGVNNLSRVYHPDIIIRSENRIIEVKSTYTVKIDSNLPYKKIACEEQGWKFDLWVFDNKHDLVDIIWPVRKI